MDHDELLALAERVLGAWNSQDVDRVLSCYTEDVDYRDPNTRGAVLGSADLRRYLTKLFGRWQMHWALREAHPFADERGCAVLWKATFRRPGSDATAEIDGIDFIELRGDRIARNEIRFDRAQLAMALGV